MMRELSFINFIHFILCILGSLAFDGHFEPDVAFEDVTDVLLRCHTDLLDGRSFGAEKSTRVLVIRSDEVHVDCERPGSRIM